MAQDAEIQALLERVESLESKITRLMARTQVEGAVQALPDIALGRQLHDLGEVSTASVYKADVQVFAHNTSANLQWDTVRWDNDALFAPATFSFNIREAGIYYVRALITVVTDAPGAAVKVAIGTNGGVRNLTQQSAAVHTTALIGEPALNCSGLFVMNPTGTSASTQVTASVKQTSGANMEIRPYAFDIVKVANASQLGTLI